LCPRRSKTWKGFQRPAGEVFQIGWNGREKSFLTPGKSGDLELPKHEINEINFEEC